jgi:lipoprotein-anchoring transpeptidase ErfK/SrfK
VLGAGVLLALPFAAFAQPAMASPIVPAAALPPAPTRVTTDTDTPLWADAGGTIPLGIAPPAAIFEPASPLVGQLVQVRDAYAGGLSFADRARLTPVAPPAALAAPGRWWGKVFVDGANLRSAPSSQAPAVGQLPAGSPVVVSAWVVGEQVVADNPAWAQLNDHTFVYSAEVRPVDVPAPPAVPVDAPTTGRWIDVNLTLQVVVAYEGRTLVRMARTSTGRPGFETPPGTYAIQRRVASETMTSAGIAGASYYVPHVRWTQYFSKDGKALHENYWKPSDQFGIPSSHGCAGLLGPDAQFLWDWASVGTPVIAHV